MGSSCFLFLCWNLNSHWDCLL